jgi:hypothetical protein
MQTIRALLVIAVIVVFGALTSSASAGRLSLSSQTWRSTFSEWRFAGGFGTMACALTLEGSLHSRTIAKVANALIGYITRAALGSCTQGSAIILTATLPWHVRYVGFTGTLPNIGSLITGIARFSFQIREPVFGITCLAASTDTRPTTGTYNREAGGALTTAEINGRVPTNCGTEGTLGGSSSSLTVLGAATRITVTLI